jgi:hypothetical protein
MPASRAALITCIFFRSWSDASHFNGVVFLKGDVSALVKIFMCEVN